MYKILFMVLCGLLFNTCSVSPEENPGLCSLTCDSAKIVGNDPGYKITPKTEDITYLCSASSAGQPLNPTLLYFLVSKDISAEEQTETEAEDGTTTTTEGTVYEQPSPYASIEPIVNGLTSDEESDNPNSPTVDGVRVPIRYKGIATPSSDWCSDSCGVVGLEVAFTCPSAGESQENTVSIHSGALFSEPITITVTTEDSQ